MNSGTVFAGIDRWISITSGMRPINATGAVSCMKLKRRLSYIAGLIALADMAIASVAVRSERTMLRCDVAACARPVVDNDGLTDPPDSVGRAGRDIGRVRQEPARQAHRFAG
jgi:hypothetical protein